MDTVTFLVNLMVSDPVLSEMVDRKILAELPRLDTKLDGAHKTVVGCSVQSENRESYYRSQIRGYLKTDISAHITVISGHGQNDSYCRGVLERLERIFQDAAYVDLSRIYVNSISTSLRTDSPPGKWVGDVKLGITRFDPVG